MLLDPAKLTKDQAEQLLAGLTYLDLVDKLVSNAISEAPFAEAARNEWLDAQDPATARAGWNLIIAEVLDGSPSQAQLTEYAERVARGRTRRR